MSHTSKEHYLESYRQRYPSRNRAGKSAMIDEVSDTLGWDRKHTIKALGRKVTHGKQARRRCSKLTHREEEQTVIISIWRHSEEQAERWLADGLKAAGLMAKDLPAL
jgi:hypothetical protein